MSEILISICNKLGVVYSDLSNYKNDCDKAEYLLDCIYQFLGGSEDA